MAPLHFIPLFLTQHIVLSNRRKPTMFQTNHLHLTSVIVITFLSLFANPVTSYGHGAPASRCETMLPGHWVTPQESIPPFQVTVDQSVISPGSRVNITLTTLRGQTGFKGFLTMVKDIQDNGKNYGVFDLTTSDVKNAQPVHCFNIKNSAMTHVVNNVKNSVELFWVAPHLEETSFETQKELRVVTTFVKDFWTVWTDVEPIGETRLLLQSTSQQPQPESQPSPKFRPVASSPAINQELQVRGEEPVLQIQETEIVPLDATNSWDHFKRAWNYAISFFN